MFKRSFKRWISSISIATIILGSVIQPAMAEMDITAGPPAPKLLITELVPDSANVNSKDAYEFIEVYNNSDVPVNFKDYDLAYRAPGPSVPLIWSAGSGDIIIPARKPLVFWVMNSESNLLTADQFNLNYGTHLTEGTNLFRVVGGADVATAGGMSNTAARDLIIQDKAKVEIAIASYQNDAQTVPDKGIFYKLPTDGKNMVMLPMAGSFAATPGDVGAFQVSDIYVNELPVITHTPLAVANPADNVTINAKITNAENISGMDTVTAAIYYKSSTESVFKAVYMTSLTLDSFKGQIPKASLTGAQLQYYIEARDSANTVKSNVYSVAIGDGSYDYTKVPPLMVTELVPDSANVTGVSSDAYEFIEVYNNTDKIINFKNYKLIYRYMDSNPIKDVEWSTGGQNILIPAQKSIVLWVINSANGALTTSDFNANYGGSGLVENENLFRIFNDGMANGTPRGIVIEDVTGKEISGSYYENDDQTQINKGIFYRFPMDGTKNTVITSAGVNNATPGVVDASQVPVNPVTLAEPPVITHTPVLQADTENDINIDAAISNVGPNETVNATVYYKVSSQSAYQWAVMNYSASTGYHAAIPRESLTETTIDYYIQANKGDLTVKTDTYTVMVKLPAFDPQKVPQLLVTEVVPDSTNVGSADGYEFVEVYNNTDQAINFKDYVIRYRYTDLGPDGDVLWPSVPNDLVIPSGKTLVFWIINTQNASKTVADFNAIYGTSLVENQNIVRIFSDGMANTGPRGLVVASNSGTDISASYYVTDAETVANKGIFYKFPVDGSSKMIKYSAGLLAATPGTVNSVQVPGQRVHLIADTMKPEITDNTGKTEVPQSGDFEISADANDDHQVKTVLLYYKTDKQADYKKEYLTESFADTLYHFMFYSPDLIGNTYLEYYFVASDGTNETSTTPVRVNITGGPDHSQLRLNLKNGDFVSNNKIIKANGENVDPSKLKLSIDDSELTQSTFTALENGAYFAFDANGVNYYFKNGVTMGQDIMQIFQDPINSYTTLSVPIQADRLKEGNNVIAIRAGTKASPFDDSPEENKDNFTVKNVRLVLADGTQIYDPKYANAVTIIKMGDSGAAVPVIEFSFNLLASKLTSKAYDWNTKTASDGIHKVSLTNEQSETITANVTIDNTAPVIVPSVKEGQLYRGPFTINAAVTDAYSGVDKVEATLDAKPLTMPFSTSSSKLAAGNHVLVVTATDKVGNKGTSTIKFAVPDENPIAPVLVSPEQGATVLAGNVRLTVKVADPTNDDLDVSFYRGFKYDANVQNDFVSYHGAAVTEPPKQQIPGGETAFTQEDYQKISKPDGDYLIDNSVEKFPYQRFEVAIDESVKATDKVNINWKGKSLEGRKVSLYAWSSAKMSWQVLDSKIAGTVDFELTADVEAGVYENGNKIQVMVQDEIAVVQDDGGSSDNYDFSFAWMSDTQYYAESYPYIFQDIVKWIADNKEKNKIKYVIHTGDIVDDADQQYEWDEANKDMKVLEDAKIPYGVLAGNHDVLHQDNDYSYYNKHFGEDRFKDQPTYGESYDNNRGHYDLISSNGNDFIIVYMGWGYGDKEIDWINEVLAKYPNRKAILNFHEYLLVSNNRAPMADKVFERVVKPNKNVFAVLSGHYHNALLHQDAIDDDGDGVPDRNVYQMLADYQGAPEGGLGYIRLLQFDMKNDKVNIKTYSPYLDDFNFYDTDEYPGKDEFSINLNIQPVTKQVATDYIGVRVYSDQLIQKNEGVISGSNSSADWNGLADKATYEWYTSVQDVYGGNKLSEIWKFTTGTPPAAPNVTVNDETNIVTGLTTAMEYKLDSADYVMYNPTIFNALDLSGIHTLLVRIAADENTGTPAGLVTTLIFTAPPGTPAAPNVTVNDETNIVTGLTTAMEYKLDSADYVMYNPTIFNALDLSGIHTLLVRIAADENTGTPAGLVTTLIFTAPPGTPAAPNVTVNDDTNIVTGLTTAMEYKLDSADYVKYDATIFNALDLSGIHTLLVRIAADENTGTPAGLITTLAFTATPGTPDSPAAPNVTLNDVTNIVTGLTTKMEYKLDTADYVMYDATIFNALDLSGIHILLVRIAADENTGTPAGLVTTLTFTQATTPPPTSPPTSTPTPAVTPTPIPTATPTPEPMVIDKGIDGAVSIPTAMLSVSQNGNTTITLPADTSEIKLPSNTVELLGDSKLELKMDHVSLNIPTNLIKQLTGLLSADELKDSSISLKLNPLSESQAQDILDKSQTSPKDSIKRAGDIYEFSLSITSKNGASANLSKFNEPITIRLKVDSSSDMNLTGVFYISDSGELEYVGGELVNGEIVAQINHFSKYAVLELNKNFDDVASSYWASNVIKGLAAKQIINGVTATTFEPAKDVTRAEFVSLLVRALKLTDKGANAFKDVSANDWYADAVSIATKAGIVNGVSGNLFKPNAPISREEMVTIMMRAYAVVNGNPDQGTTESSFKDDAKISAWASQYVKTAVALNLIKGRTSSTFDPQGITSRAEAAQVIYNLLNK
ncbi:hypothetical protein EHS13_29645 [Paenibacillus psychroresistens]|uniref:Metallophosphoesterase n=1 Tax=Paenibacillus psychroresistens TaxID=1778678 RepID=A0A6B8RTW2_9BACL|nr:S-layer homology domain-containing protein [Paenibacillus psychroresistens]QGQ98746.1 hypothetical protein EHS13_29645 [Paenibacillus psychroresistens]